MNLFPFVLAMTSLQSISAFSGTIKFDDMKAGQPPIGWTVAVTGKGESRWTVETDGKAPSKPNALKQSEQGTYPICFKDTPRIKGGFGEVKFKPVAGDEDRAGGVSWRLRA